MWPWRVKMPTQNLFRLWLLLILMLWKRFDDSLVHIWKLEFGQKVNYVFWAQSLVKILKFKFRQYFEGEVWSVFCSQCFLRLWSLTLVEIQKEARFWILSLVQMLMFGWDFEVDARLRLEKWNLINVYVRTCEMTQRSYFGKQNSTLGSVVPMAVWQCLYLYLHLLKSVLRNVTLLGPHLPLSTTSSTVYTVFIASLFPSIVLGQKCLYIWYGFIVLWASEQKLVWLGEWCGYPLDCYD